MIPIPTSRLTLAGLTCGILLAGPATPAHAVTFTGKVVGISDGDTISVMRAGKAVKVRLEGIDCPERRQAFGNRARQFTAELVARQVVPVEVRGHVRFGLLVGRVVWIAQDVKGLDTGGELGHPLQPLCRSSGAT